MKGKGTKENKEKEKKKIELTLEEAICPICLSIMIEPVTMPCEHSLCSPCFTNNVEQAALACPLCRKRISVWVRRTKREGKLVNEDLWKYMQDNFPNKIEARLQGKDDQDIEGLLTPKTPKVSCPGEIRKEYELELAHAEAEREAREKAEFEASVEIITKLQEEEKKKAELEELCQKDLEIAKKLREEQLMAERHARRRSTKKILNFSPISCSQKGPMYSFLESTPKSSHVAGPSNIHIKSEKIDPSDVLPMKALGDITSSQNSDPEFEDLGRPIKTDMDIAKGKENMGESSEQSFITANGNRKSPIMDLDESEKNESSMALRLSTSTDFFDSTINNQLQPSSEVEKEEKPETDQPTSQPVDDQISFLPNLSDINPESDEWKKLVEEQELLEQRLQQEKEDRKLALQLSRDMKNVNRKKGTEGEYSLRNSLGTQSKDKKCTPNRSKRPRSPNQSTIMESFAKRRKMD